MHLLAMQGHKFPSWQRLKVFGELRHWWGLTADRPDANAQNDRGGGEAFTKGGVTSQTWEETWDWGAVGEQTHSGLSLPARIKSAFLTPRPPLEASA